MTLYDNCRYPVRPEVTASHQASLDGFSRPGTWWTGAQRAEIVAETRRARVDAGIQEADGWTDKGPGGIADIPDAARAVARQIGVAPKDIGRDFYDGNVPDGLTDTEYVELVGICARVVDLDIFARGAGMPMANLADPEGGEPSRARPETAGDDTAFAPMVYNGRRGGDVGQALYGGEMMPNILRATSLVPNECEDVKAIALAQYVSMDEFMNMNFSNDPAISRTQMELVAGRISAINECFY
jgi:hypothetical protein